MNNKELYESTDVVSKYAVNSTRVRCLNNAEKDLIDRFDIKDKKVLVLGGGAGRVPSNLLLFGNTVTSVERSENMYKASVTNFPKETFPSLDLHLGDATDLSAFPDNSFDVVLFPQNGIDYIDSIELREKAISEMVKKLRPGGIFAFGSHNKTSYYFSHKTRWSDRMFANFKNPYIYDQESVIGGGNIFKGRPEYVISRTKKISGAEFIGFTCDTRNKFDRFMSRNINTAKYVFPYLIYVFKKGM